MKEKVQARTFQLSLRIIAVVESLSKGPVYWVIGKQLIRSSTSVGANYRAVSRAKSNPDFIHKLTIVEEEADESLYWLELLAELDLPEETLAEINLLKTEMNEILSMVVASIKTMKQKSKTNNL